jgi:hypothetical protein
MRTKREDTIVRWAQAIWDAEVAVGMCQPGAPSSMLQEDILRAAAAAVAVLSALPDTPEWPVRIRDVMRDSKAA